MFASENIKLFILILKAERALQSEKKSFAHPETIIKCLFCRLISSGLCHTQITNWVTKIQSCS